MAARNPSDGVRDEFLHIRVAPTIGSVIAGVRDVHDATDGAVAQNHRIDCRGAACNTLDPRAELGNAHIGCRREGEGRGKTGPNGVHGKRLVDGVIDLAAVCTDARQQDERGEGLPAASDDLIRGPFGEDDTIATDVDEIEQCGLTGSGHVGLERRVSRSAGEHDDGAESCEWRIGAIVLIRRDCSGRGGKSSRGQRAGQGSCTRLAVVGNDQHVRRACAGGIDTHA